MVAGVRSRARGNIGASFPDLSRRAGDAKAADPSIEQPTKFDLVINLKTAGAVVISESTRGLLGNFCAVSAWLLLA
jgi:hypothetical protein